MHACWIIARACAGSTTNHIVPHRLLALSARGVGALWTAGSIQELSVATVRKAEAARPKERAFALSIQISAH
eukprot:6199575-Pleurochrysis_carterae.AAC.1